MTNTRSLYDVTLGAVKKASLQPQDEAAIGLALLYALRIDTDLNTLGDLGPKLLAVLTSLGMTPTGRGVKGGSQGVPVTDKLDELAERRAARSGTNGA